MRTAPAQPPDAGYEERVLQHVSRSFALTIPQLPPSLRRAVTNAYLLCRIIDTIEDDENLSLEQKRFFLQEFVKIINVPLPANEFADTLAPLLSSQALPEEKDLIRHTPSVLQTTLSFNETQQAVIRRCSTIMAQGMLEFQENKSPRGLKDLAHMDRLGLYREAFRILKSRGRLLFFDILKGNGLEPDYPLPWANDQSISFLYNAEETKGFLSAAGFQELQHGVARLSRGEYHRRGVHRRAGAGRRQPRTRGAGGMPARGARVRASCAIGVVGLLRSPNRNPRCAAAGSGVGALRPSRAPDLRRPR